VASAAVPRAQPGNRRTASEGARAVLGDQYRWHRGHPQAYGATDGRADTTADYLSKRRV